MTKTPLVAPPDAATPDGFRRTPYIDRIVASDRGGGFEFELQNSSDDSTIFGPHYVHENGGVCDLQNLKRIFAGDLGEALTINYVITNFTGNAGFLEVWVKYA